MDHHDRRELIILGVSHIRLIINRIWIVFNKWR